MKKKLLNRYVWDNKNRLDKMLDDMIGGQPEMILSYNRVRAHRIMVDICDMYERVKELEAENNYLRNELTLKPLEEVLK